MVVHALHGCFEQLCSTENPMCASWNKRRTRRSKTARNKVGVWVGDGGSVVSRLGACRPIVKTTPHRGRITYPRLFHFYLDCLVSVWVFGCDGSRKFQTVCLDLEK